MNSNIDQLKTREDNKDFHLNRIIFVFKDDIIFYKDNTELSHLEWFREAGWINNENQDNFIDNTVRGCYIPASNSLYFYKGVFKYDNELIVFVKNNLLKLVDILNLKDNVKINFGPVDEVIRGVRYDKKFAGNLKDFLG